MNRRDRRKQQKEMKKMDNKTASPLGIAGAEPEMKKMEMPGIIPSNAPVIYSDFVRMSGEQSGGAIIEFSKYYPDQHVCKEQQSVVIPAAMAKEMIIMLCNMYQFFPTKEEAAQRMKNVGTEETKPPHRS
jgi:hypothetical protein